MLGLGMRNAKTPSCRGANFKRVVFARTIYFAGAHASGLKLGSAEGRFGPVKLWIILSQ